MEIMRFVESAASLGRATADERQHIASAVVDKLRKKFLFFKKISP